MRFKVVKIIDEYLIVVNYGKIHNAKSGDILEIFEIGKEVFDPNNGNSLGTLDPIKGKLKVINVYEKMSLCKSNETVPSQLSQTLITVGRAISHYEIKALNVNTRSISGGYSEDKELLIDIGDPVRVIHSSFEDELKKEENGEGE